MGSYALQLLSRHLHPCFRRLLALVAKGARGAERGDERVADGEDDVAGRDFAHGHVEGVAGFVSVARGRPEIAAGVSRSRQSCTDPYLLAFKIFVFSLVNSSSVMMPRFRNSSSLSNCS
jgi:hypothetical protein